MFSIICNLDNPSNGNPTFMNVVNSNSPSVRHHCIDCGQRVLVKKRENKYPYTSIKHLNYLHRRFIYYCSLCGASYYSVQNRHNQFITFQRIYFDNEPIDDELHKKLISNYVRPGLLVDKNRQLRVCNTNYRDKFNKTPGTPATSEDVIFDFENDTQGK